jgi:rare lipoprotein A
MARSRTLSLSENAPVRWRIPFWTVPAILLSAYMGVVIANPDPQPEAQSSLAGGATASITRTLVRPLRASLKHEAAAGGDAVRGVASWYGSQFHGLRTASGAPFDMYAMTAAHRTLPLGSHARVTNLENGTSVEVQITDRGPHVRRRIIDLSYGAAEEIGMVADGSALVEVTPLAD